MTYRTEVQEVFGERERDSTSRVDSLARKVSSTTPTARW